MNPPAAAIPAPSPWSRWTDHTLRMEGAVAWTFGEASLPPAVEAQARLMLIDTIGCMIAARAAPEVAALEEQYGKLEYGHFRYPGGHRLSTHGALTVGATAATWDEACEGNAVAHGLFVPQGCAEGLAGAHPVQRQAQSLGAMAHSHGSQRNALSLKVLHDSMKTAVLLAQQMLGWNAAAIETQLGGV